MSDANGVGSISGGTLDADAKKKTGKTMEQLTEEKRKQLDEKIARTLREHQVRQARPQRHLTVRSRARDPPPRRPLVPSRARRQLLNGLAAFVLRHGTGMTQERVNHKSEREASKQSTHCNQSGMERIMHRLLIPGGRVAA
jgi:hypothetical protein